MTNQAATTNETAVQAYVPSFNLPILVDRDEVMEVIKDNLEGITPEFVRVKFPSGGGLTFEVPGEDGEPEPVKELQGVIVDHHPVYAYWKEKFNGEKNAPDCSSLDGKMGFAPGLRSDGSASPMEWAGEHRDCASCPFNQYGTAVDDKGQKTNGKACKNMKRVFMLPEGQIFPLVVTVPPTSLKAFSTHIVGLTSRAKPFTGVVTSIRLKKEKSGGGIEYSAGIFTKAKDLTKQEAVAMKQYAAELKPVMRNLVIDSEDYVEAKPSQMEGGPVDISAPDEPLY